MPVAPPPIKEEVIRLERVEIPYDVMRHQLGSIDPSNLKELTDMDESEQKNRHSEAALIYTKKFFKREIDLLKDSQVYAMAEQYDGQSQHDFGKGTVNGISLVYEHIEQLAGKHLSETAPKEEYDKYGTNPETPISAIIDRHLQ